PSAAGFPTSSDPEAQACAPPRSTSVRHSRSSRSVSFFGAAGAAGDAGFGRAFVASWRTGGLPGAAGFDGGGLPPDGAAPGLAAAGAAGFAGAVAGFAAEAPAAGFVASSGLPLSFASSPSSTSGLPSNRARSSVESLGPHETRRRVSEASR